MLFYSRASQKPFQQCTIFDRKTPDFTQIGCFSILGLPRNHFSSIPFLIEKHQIYPNWVPFNSRSSQKPFQQYTIFNRKTHNLTHIGCFSILGLPTNNCSSIPFSIEKNTILPNLVFFCSRSSQKLLRQYTFFERK